MDRRDRLSSDPNWWATAAIYHIYVRSFQDSDGDGIGDLTGIHKRIEYIASLGVDAVWLSPIYPSPLADFGYDVSEFCDVDPAYGTLQDFDRLVAEAHTRGLRVLLDLVVGHTSIEHAWVREHPERYTWWDGDAPPNNWIAAFGGPAWTRDPVSGRWYHHAFYPEQPSLDWHRQDVMAAIADVIRFWLDRGVDGFRIDALEQLLSDPQLRDDQPAPPTRELPLPDNYYPPQYGALDHVHSQSPEGRDVALHAIREAAGDAFLLGEIIVPTSKLASYIEVLDAAFCFEFLLAPVDARALRQAIQRALAVGRLVWVRSNHDFARLASVAGPDRLKAMLLLLLTLPGPAVLYQGDELGLIEGPGTQPKFDRAGRDRLRHPMQWDASPSAGFTSGDPWLPVVRHHEFNVDSQRHDPRSVLAFARELLALRRELGTELQLLDAADGVIAYRLAAANRADVVAINLSSTWRAAPAAGTVVAATHAIAPSGPAPDGLEPGEGFVFSLSQDYPRWHQRPHEHD